MGVQKNMGRKKLGELLVEDGLISPEQMERALAEQQRTGEKLGRVLVRLGFATEKDIITVLEKQLGIARVGDIRFADPEILEKFTEQVARKYRAVPVKRENGRLAVAMADPTDLMAIDDLRLVTGLDIEPLLAGEWEIEGAIQKLYGMPDLERAFAELQVVERDETLLLDQTDEPRPDEAPVVKLINSIIIQAIDERASDIHIEPGPASVRVRYRVDGLLRHGMELPRKARASVAARVKILAGLNIAERRLPQDGRIQIDYRGRKIDLRVSVLPSVFGEKIVIRILDRSRLIARIDELGLMTGGLDLFRRALRSSYGMILVAGPTGSGKTTTLYAALHELHTPERNIVTVEDPVEYILDGVTQCQVSEKTGFTFAVGLRAILRQDPDIIMLGEIRDTETARMAIRAATTGHLVLSTLHTNDAVGAVVRLIDMGVQSYLVGACLVAVVAQRLVRVICPRCKEAYVPEPRSPERVFLGVAPDEEMVLYRGRGCGYCGETGYRGRIGVFEVLLLDRALREMITAGVPVSEVRATARQAGLVTLHEDAVQKVKAGITTVQEAIGATLVEGE